MKIIVLQGVSNSGKTSTVKKMIEKLLKKYPNVNPLYHNRTFRHAMAAGTAKGGNGGTITIFSGSSVNASSIGLAGSGGSGGYGGSGGTYNGVSAGAGSRGSNGEQGTKATVVYM